MTSFSARSQSAAGLKVNEIQLSPDWARRRSLADGNSDSDSDSDDYSMSAGHLHLHMRCVMGFSRMSSAVRNDVTALL